MEGISYLQGGQEKVEAVHMDSLLQKLAVKKKESWGQG